MKKLVLVLSLCLGLAGLALAQPQISGPLSGTMGPGEYQVVGACSVYANQTLTLLPGTTFLFAGHYNLVINTNGTLLAVGTELDSIVFTRQFPDTSCNWGGIRFAYTALSNSILSYCLIEYARYHPWPNTNGGALYSQSHGITITHCTIANNSAQEGGGIYINAGSVTISNCVFADNSASTNGGGLQFKWSSNAMVSNCVFLNNSSLGPLTAHGGGGIRCEDLIGSPSTFTNNLLFGNTAVYKGAGFMSSGTSTYGSIPTLINNTIVQNSCTSTSISAVGGGLMVATVEDTVIGQNNIVYGNYSTNDPNISGTALFTYSCVEGGLLGTGNIDADPLFLTGPGGVYYLSQIAAGQAVNSPCVDTGDPASPMITGTTRTDQAQDAGIVDMGYHYEIIAVLPSLEVTLTPHNPPIQVNPGGFFWYLGELDNNTPDPITFDLWADAILPNGAHYGPLLLYNNLTIGGMGHLERAVRVRVPRFAPPGNYQYYAAAGTYPSAVIDDDQFPFTILVGDPVSSNNQWLAEPFEGVIPVPTDYSLGSASPNPFNPVTTISFGLPEDAKVKLVVYDVNGREAATLVDGLLPAGLHEVEFNGAGLASGIYFYRLSAPGFTMVKKMALVK